MQALDNPSCLAIERHRIAGIGIEHHDTDRRGVDQRFHVGAGALLVAVRASVGDRRCRLRGEHEQDLFIRSGELRSVLLSGEIEVADMPGPMAHRRAHEGFGAHQVRGKTERADVLGKVRQSQRRRQVAEVFEEPQPVGPGHNAPVLLRGEARGEEVAGLAGIVDGRDPAAAGADQRAGAVENLLQDDVDVEACADAQDGRAQPGDAVVLLCALPPCVVVVRHCACLARWGR